MNFSNVSSTIHQAIWALSAQVAPAILWHYTTSTGLLGIVGERKIRLTHIAYLNDRHEILAARRVLEEAASAAMVGADAKNKGFLAALTALLQDSSETVVSIQPIFVGSFSLEKDSLAQWRAYGRGEGGFSIGFDASAFWDVKNRHPRVTNLWLLPCIYDKAKQLELARLALEHAAPLVAASSEPDKELAERFLLDLSWIGPCIKHEAFASEREWRLVYFLSGQEDLEIIDFSDCETLKPFISYDFGDQDGFKSCLREVQIGPQRHAELAQIAAHHFLQKKLGQKFEVSLSSIPYRSL